MDPVYNEFVGVSDLHYAKILEDSIEKYLAEVPKFLAPTAEIANNVAISKTPTFYDNKPGSVYTSEGATELTFTVSGIPVKLAAYLLGKAYDAAAGRMYDDGEPKPPYVAVGFKFNKGVSDFRYYWYLKGTFSGGTEDAKTKGENIEVKTYQLTFTAVVTSHVFDNINGEKKSLKRVVGETTDPAFIGDGWFDQVQTPDSIGKPDELELVSSTPAHEASDVAIDTNPELLFNNPILDECVTLIKSDGTKVEIIKSFSSDRKKITLSHSTAFDNGTTYSIVVSGVKDDYGQELPTTVKTFTIVA